MSVRMQSTAVRVVCANTMSVVTGGASDRGDGDVDQAVRGGIAFRHSGDMKSKLEDARAAILRARKDMLNTVEVYRAMRATSVSASDVRDFAKKIFDADVLKAEALARKLRARIATEEGELKQKLADKIRELEVLAARETRAQTAIVESFESGPGADVAGANVWGLLNAATDYIDFQRGRGEESRLNQSWFGVGADLRANATDLAISMLA
jgi:hypothetical protein